MMRIAHGFLAVALTALVMLAAAGQVVRAASFDDAVAHFADDDFSATAAAVADLGASGDARAEAVLDALRDGRLVFESGKPGVYINDASGKLTVAGTGAAATVADPTALSNVRLNNRIRGAVTAALGGLTLMAPDPAKRRAAATAVLLSRDQGALPALDQAIAAEKDAG